MTPEGEKGPYYLVQLPDVGVRPDTYVWYKGMSDWHRAIDVPEVYEFFRQRLGDHNLPQQTYEAFKDSMERKPEQTTQASQQIKETEKPPKKGLFDDINEAYSKFPTIEQLEHETSTAKPVNMLPLAILAALCFPPAGFVAVYYAYVSRKVWTEANSPAVCPEQSEYLQEEARDLCRMAKMWTGISFSLGLLLIAVLLKM